MDDDLKRIAGRIRAWRDEAELTLQQLGDRSGVSASTIHKIENLQTVPTIAVLLKVANGLNRRPSELLASSEESRPVALLRRAERPRFHIPGRAALEHLIGMTPHNRLDLWRVVMEPGRGAGSDDDPWRFRGEIAIVCESGCIECEIADQHFELGPGDSIHFDTSVSHRWVAGGGAPATATIFALMPEKLHGDLMTRIARTAVARVVPAGEGELALPDAEAQDPRGSSSSTS